VGVFIDKKPDRSMMQGSAEIRIIGLIAATDIQFTHHGGLIRQNIASLRIASLARTLAVLLKLLEQGRAPFKKLQQHSKARKSKNATTDPMILSPSLTATSGYNGCASLPDGEVSDRRAGQPEHHPLGLV